MTLKPWREIAVPHADVLAGTFQQSEFAADISSVRKGTAPAVYQDAHTFYDRTFITEGMRLLLTQVAERLNGRGGEPVIQLQTSFGGGKTHTMLAVYHLARRECPLSDLAGIPPLLHHAGLMDVPLANVAILDGNEHSPGQPWKHGKTAIHTLWGELAWQLGGAEAYQKVLQSDLNGTSPGKELLADILSQAAPCVVLVDELVAYVRQFHDGRAVSGGTYDSNLSFLQALTEAAKVVPNALVLASLPESEVEAGSSLGTAALRALEKLFGRVQALWKPVAIEESFEIVRRRLFEPIRDEVGRDAVCAAFAELYRSEGSRLPSECAEARYQERLVRAYPIHPEVFDRLYEDWTTLDGFQRTRGVLKLMAKAIHRLWRDQNADLMLMPGSLPLYSGGARDELTYYLGAGWDPVIDKDVDGDHSEASELDAREPRFGACQAARRVARTIFLASAPSAVSSRASATKGVERGRILLGTLQPGQSSATFVDALSRLADRLHYLNASGDKALDGTRFWFDVRANLRREMEDRKGRLDDRRDVRSRVAELLGKLTRGSGLFDAVHVFTPHSDVADDGKLRLVLLDFSSPYSHQEPKPARETVLDYLKFNGAKPRFRANRLLFLAIDAGSLGRVRDAVRVALAWKSIVEDISGGRLNIDRLQEGQAKRELETAEAVALRAVRDGWKWLLCPTQLSSTDREITLEAKALATSDTRGGPSDGALLDPIDSACRDGEWVIAGWSPIHLVSRLRSLYWRDGKTAVAASAVWEDHQRYLYLDRLKDQKVFDQAILSGAAGRDFFGLAVGLEGERLLGFSFGQRPAFLDSTTLLVETATAAAYDLARVEAGQRQAEAAAAAKDGAVPPAAIVPLAGSAPGQAATSESAVLPSITITPAVGRRYKAWFGSVDVPAATARMRLVQIAEEIIEVLAGDPNAQLRISIEIDAEFPSGASDSARRSVSDNAAQLKFKRSDWE
jgi:predicted AAA+ superfamily ATPase